MSRSIKDLRELICISRLSMRSDGSDEDLPSNNSDDDDDAYYEPRADGIASLDNITNRVDSKAGFATGRESTFPSVQRRKRVPRQFSNGNVRLQNSTDRKTSHKKSSSINTGREIVVGRPKSAVGGVRRPETSYQHAMSHKIVSPGLASETKIPAKSASSSSATTYSCKESSFSETSSKKGIEEDTGKYPSSPSNKFRKENRLLAENRVEEILQYIDANIVSGWLEKSNEVLDDMIKWLKQSHNFISIASFILTEFHYSKRKELTQMEVSIILDELEFAFKVGIQDGKVNVNDLEDLLGIILREHPVTLQGRKGAVCLLNIMSTFCCGRDENFRNLLSNVKYSTRNKQIVQWLLGMRAFSLVNLCSGMVAFYKGLSDIQRSQHISKDISEGHSATNLKHSWLFNAIEFDYFEVFQYLIENQISHCQDAKNEQGRNVITQLVACGKEKMLKYFIEKVMFGKIQ